ncbi:MAG: hypothetical protein GY945_13735, partial [Rhodobacteraceae bacterium]|nr:hypothetical protein [Paracoccaceae bacterium]
MRRKAGAGRPPPEIGRMTAIRALRAAVAQGAEEAVELVATTTEVTESRITIAAFTEKLPENALFALCQGADDQLGMVVLDDQSIAALIEMQTTGRVVPNKAAPRPPTRTDALLSTGFIDRVLSLFEQGVALAELKVARAVSGYSYAFSLDDVRAVEMTLPDLPYRLFEMGIDFSEEAKHGRMMILLPYDVALPEASTDSSAWQEDLTELVQCTRVEMEAVLARKEMILSDVAAFQIGTLLPLPREVVSRIMLEDLNGGNVTLGRLGQAGGCRAIRIAQPCSKTQEGEVGFATSNNNSSNENNAEMLEVGVAGDNGRAFAEVNAVEPGEADVLDMQPDGDD